jgi:hypothetical protein
MPYRVFASPNGTPAMAIESLCVDKKRRPIEGVHEVGWLVPIL